MTTSSQTPGELKPSWTLSLPWRRANIVPGGWPRLPRRIARFLRCARHRRGLQQPGQRAAGSGPARRSSGPIRAGDGPQARSLPGTQQPGQHPAAAGQARPGRGTAIEQVIALRPDLAEPHNNLGNVLLSQGKLDEAAARFEQALGSAARSCRAAQQPGQRPAGAGPARPGRGTVSASARAQARLRRGASTTWATSAGSRANSTRRRHVIEQALALKPDFAEAHYHLTDLKTFRAGDRRSRRAGGAGRRNATVCRPARCCISTLRSARRWKTSATITRAFEHWLQGNALKRREIDYDEAACAASVPAHRRGVRRRPARPLSGGGRSLAVADLRPRHAPFRQHADRADSGQPPTGPRRRRTAESAIVSSKRCPTPAGRPASFPAWRRRTRRRRLAATGPGLSGKPAGVCRTARRGSPTRCLAIFYMSV